MRGSAPRDPRRGRASWRLALALGALLLAHGQSARAQPSPSPLPASAPGREAELEARLRRMEAVLQKMPDPAHVQQMEATIRQLSTRVQQLSTSLAEAEARRPATPIGARPSAANGAGPAANPAGNAGVGAGPAANPAGNAGVGEEVVGGSAGVSPAAEAPSSRFQMPEPIPNLPLRTRFGPGFEFKTPDDEYTLQFHNLTQFDFRGYAQANQTEAVDTFTFPREWLIFSGHMTKPYEYYVAISEGFDTFNILDVFLNVNYNKALQFRAGRFKTPFTYEFYAEPTQGLANGEWSLFFNNFGMNRDLGAMVWGQAFRDRVDYAAGIFNSTRNAFVDLSDAKEFIGFLNVSPWETEIDSPLENLNFGGSVVAGNQQHIPFPQEFRTIVPTNGNGVLGVPFLNLNNNVLASGPQAFWSMHAAYFYQQLSLIAEWDGGFEDYGLTGHTTHTRVPVESFYVQAAYILTGERVASRGMVKPIHPFDLRPGKLGFGAWEIAARYSLLDLGNQVFTAGLADPNLWTNRLDTIDVGLSWYWNQYIRILFDWQHADFGSPVYYQAGGRQKTSEMFFLRFQLWF